MSGYAGGGVFLDRIADFTLDGLQVLTLPRSIDVVRITNAGNTPKLAGLRDPQPERAVLIVNATGSAIDIEHNSTTADPADRFIISSTMVLPAGRFTIGWYDPFTLCWRLLSR